MKKGLFVAAASVFIVAVSLSTISQYKAHALACNPIPKAKVTLDSSGTGVTAKVTSDYCHNGVRAWAQCLGSGATAYGSPVYNVGSKSSAGCLDGVHSYGYQYHKNGAWHNG